MKTDLAQLYRLCYEMLLKFGASKDDAADTAYMMNEADRRGVDTHGCARMPMLTNMIIDKKINLAPEIKPISESDSFLYLDADHGIGFAAGAYAVRKTIEKAKKTGFCVTSVKNSGFWGASGSYAAEFAKHKLFGVAASNTGAAIIPFGGTSPVFGNAPFSMAFPGTKKYQFPIMFDMATSNIAFGKIQTAMREKRESIPDDWVISRQTGRPITNTMEAFSSLVGNAASLAVFGGVKGYCITAMEEILCSVLSGAGLPKDNGQGVTITGNSKPENSGLFLLAFDISRIRPLAEIEESMDALLDEIKNQRPADGVDEVLIPGELEYKYSLKRSKEPFEILDQTANELLGVAKNCGYVDAQATVSELFEK
jgi:LDH2 family malate/lactate/ureidoglycolate dehydrogenase